MKRRSNMAIYPKIETRRAKRRNGAAYQHRRRRSLTGGHSVIAHGRRMEYQRSRSMFLTHGIARLTAKSWSDRASLPRKRARSAHAQLFAHRLRSPTWSHVCAGPLKLYLYFQILEPSPIEARIVENLSKLLIKQPNLGYKSCDFEQKSCTHGWIFKKQNEKRTSN